MKKIIRTAWMLVALFAVCALWAGEKHTLYLVRHGQIEDGKLNAPTKETALTPLGEEQAKLVGEHLKNSGFQGTIYASPYYRTLQTASFICDALDTKFIVDAGLQEAGPSKTGKEMTRIRFGCTKDQFTKYFPRCIVPEDFPEPWRFHNESKEQRDARMVGAMDELLNKTPGGNVLFVSHGGIMTVLRKELEKRGGKISGNNWNCCLLVYELDENNNVVACHKETEKYFTPMQQTDNFVNAKVAHPEDPRYERIDGVPVQK